MRTRRDPPGSLPARAHPCRWAPNQDSTCSGGWPHPPTSAWSCGVPDAPAPVPIDAPPGARRSPQENRRPLSRGCRAVRWLDLRLSFAQREQAGHDVTETAPGRLDPRDLVAEGDPAASRGRPRRQVRLRCQWRATASSQSAGASRSREPGAEGAGLPDRLARRPFGPASKPRFTGQGKPRGSRRARSGGSEPRSGRSRCARPQRGVSRRSPPISTRRCEPARRCQNPLAVPDRAT
jgi:hypothetical protein